VKSLIKKILLEEVKKTECEYQVREIGGADIYYKKKLLLELLDPIYH
jgi:hypothetical protein